MDTECTTVRILSILSIEFDAELDAELDFEFEYTIMRRYGRPKVGSRALRSRPSASRHQLLTTPSTQSRRKGCSVISSADTIPVGPRVCPHHTLETRNGNDLLCSVRVSSNAVQGVPQLGGIPI